MTDNYKVDFQQRLINFGYYINDQYIQFLKRLDLHRHFVKAKGSLVYDAEGNCYIDCIAGYGNCNIGHNHPKVIEAITKELLSERPFNLPFISDVQTMLAEKLAEITPGELECSLIVNSGAEAVESALKLARLSTRKPGIIAASGAWHGFTFGAMSVSEPSMCTAFNPMLADVIHVPYNDINAVELAINEQIGAVIVEPIQAESGAIVPDEDYLNKLSRLCSQKKLILIFDEVKTGIAKTGNMFACEKGGAVPDILLSGKSLGGGVAPIGTMTAKRNIWRKLGYSFPMSSSSGGGNAPSCAAALATLEVVQEEGLCEQAHRKGELIKKELSRIISLNQDMLLDVSGRGLLLGLHVDDIKTATRIIEGCIKNNVLMMVAFCDRSCILIEPPLCISDSEIERLLDVLDKVLKDIKNK